MINVANLRVLIADDHFLIRQFVRRTLLDVGITTIDMASHGNEAIDMLGNAMTENRVYDLMFLDWNMPGLSGIDVLNYARSKTQYQNSAVVMFTAESEKGNIMKAIKLGATSYVLKPISPMDLTKKVREIIDWLDSRRVGKV